MKIEGMRRSRISKCGDALQKGARLPGDNNDAHKSYDVWPALGKARNGAYKGRVRGGEAPCLARGPQAEDHSPACRCYEGSRQASPL